MDEGFTSKKLNKLLKKENLKWPEKLKRVDKSEWPERLPENVIEVWRSRYFLLQVYMEKNVTRLTVCRATIATDGRWKDSISWDDLQEIKMQCGRGTYTAIEIYPPDDSVVNVANMRHLWVLDSPPEFMWNK